MVGASAAGLRCRPRVRIGPGLAAGTLRSRTHGAASSRRRSRRSPGSRSRYAIGVAGDVFVTVSLADTLFFDVDDRRGAARRSLLYLLLTMAPFAVVAPVFGPLLDRTRGGRRLMFAASHARPGGAVPGHGEHVDSAVALPARVRALVLSKGQSVAKSALVPAVVDDKDELVLANSRLAIIAVARRHDRGAVRGRRPQDRSARRGCCASARSIFVVGAFASFGHPAGASRSAPAETADERALLHAPSIVAGGNARWPCCAASVGFFTFFAAFVLKTKHEPAWMFGSCSIDERGRRRRSAGPRAAAPQEGPRGVDPRAARSLVPALPLVFAARVVRPARRSCVGRDRDRGVGRVRPRRVRQPAAARRRRSGARARAFARFETRFQLVWVRRRAARGAVPRRRPGRHLPRRARAAVRRALVRRRGPSPAPASGPKTRRRQPAAPPE